jgi:hypothetical protein
VKVMLDQIFGENFFQNEVVWKRTSAHSDSKQGAKQFGRVHDSIFLYSGGKKWTFNAKFVPYDVAYVESHYRYIEEGTGRRFRKGDLTANKGGGDTEYQWRGMKPYKARYWAYSRAKMEEFEKQGRLVYTRSGMPEYKRYLDEMPGMLLGDVWDDISPLNSQAQERLGYPTQKPLALLERILEISSNENDIVLDAFCGCGTALVAAQKLKRQWIGIDISPTACRVMAQRMKKDCGLKEDEKLQQIGRGFVVRDLPKTEAELRKYPPFEFENWAVVALGGTKNARQVGDMGIDGRIYPVTAMPERRGARTGEMEFMDEWYPIQVKQKDRVGRPDIDAFEAVMIREERTLGYFVGFDFTGDALYEIDRFQRKEGREIRPLTVREILDEEVSAKS